MLRIRPIKRTDLQKEGSKSIQSVITSMKINQDCNNLDAEYLPPQDRKMYGISKMESEMEDTSIYHSGTHIVLTIPIVNVFLAGRDLSVFKRLLYKYVDVERLNKGSSVLEVNLDGTYQEIPASRIDKTVGFSNKYKIGGEAIKYVLRSIDIEKEISAYLYHKIYKAVPSKIKKPFDNDGVPIGYVVKGAGDLFIIDNYYFNVHDVILKEHVRKVLDDVRKGMLLKSGKGEFLPRISVLLSYRDRPETIVDMIQDVVPVLQIGFRPTIDSQKDPLTITYNRLVKDNNELNQLLSKSNARLESVRIAYQTVYMTYYNLIMEKRTFDKPNYKPILDILIGKEGVIRENLQASIVDYAGRGVITSDPNMSIKNVGIPEEMALNICFLDAIRQYTTNQTNKSDLLSSDKRRILLNKAKDILTGMVITIGRQPTLHKLGIQGFEVIVVPGSSIVVNPLATPAFNADFDGDQMHSRYPVTVAGKEEAKKLMLNINNPFLPRDGSCHIAPRMEMIYGLYKCFNAEPTTASRSFEFESMNDLWDNGLDMIYQQDMLIDDNCTVAGKKYKSVGMALLKSTLNGTKMYRIGVTPITDDESIAETTAPKESWYKELFKEIRLNYNADTFCKVVDKNVKLGFMVSNLYAPDINVLHKIDINDLLEEFSKNIEERERLFNLGFEPELLYSSFYTGEYGKLEKKVLERIKSKLGPDNGYIQLIESGARGSSSNLMQLFGMKGTVMKNQVEAFNVIIRHCLSDQLSGLEHFITNHGARFGVIDKVIGTFAPGYLSRQMSHVSRNINIVSDDCGTNDGLHFTYDFLFQMYGRRRLAKVDVLDYPVIKDYAVDIMTGRYIVGGGNSPLTKAEASKIFSSCIATLNGDTVVKYEGVKLRSPITCKDQCCAKCYGIDLNTNREAIPGAPVGFTASQSIGEPVTQLIMKNFQKGGVAGTKNLTSSFDMITNILEMYSVSKNDTSQEPISHDLISKVTGYIRTISKGNGTSKLEFLDEKGKRLTTDTIYVYDNIPLKSYVHAGESIQLDEGDLDVNEILEYQSVEAAQMYLLFEAYNIFFHEIKVNFKHFEILVAGMTLHLCYKGNSYFRTGNFYTTKELYTHNSNDCEFYKVVRGLKQVPKVKTDVMTALYLEDVSKTMSRAITMSGYDELKDPFVRLTFGLKPGIGTDVPEYLEKRSKCLQ